MKIKDKIALVTGASSGIGLATARLLTQKGAKVALAARSIDKLAEISKSLPNSLPIKADMTKEEEVRNMVDMTVKHFGKVDILINNAGQGYDAAIEEINIEKFHKLFDLDILGPLIAMQKVIPIMRKNKEGAIINISSGTALKALPEMSAYSSLKRALVGLSLTAREELKDDGIVVSVVYPYIMLTDFEKNTMRESPEERVFSDDGDLDFRPPDTAEFIAERIVEGIESGEAEIFAHDWMKKMR